MKNEKQILELKDEFLELQKDTDFEFANDDAGFVDWLASEIKRLKEDVAEAQSEAGESCSFDESCSCGLCRKRST